MNAAVAICSASARSGTIIHRVRTMSGGSASERDTVGEALHLYRRFRYGEAGRLAKRVLARDPQNDAARELVALCAVRLGRLTEGRATADEVLRRNPASVGARLALAIAHDARDDLPASEAAAREALRHDPSSWEARTWLAYVLSGAGHHEDALATLDAAPPSAYSTPEGQRELAAWRVITLVNLGRLDEAERAADDALAHPAAGATSLACKGWVRLRRRDAGGAADLFAQALRREPSHPWPADWLNEALEAQPGFYGGLLRVLSWEPGLRPRTWLLVMVAAAVAWVAMPSAPNAFPDLSLILWAAMGAYTALAAAGWLQRSLRDLALLASPHGRLLVTHFRAGVAVLVGVLLSAAGGAFAVYLALGSAFGALAAALLVPLAVVLAAVARVRPGPARVLALAAVAIVAWCGLAAVAIPLGQNRAPEVRLEGSALAGADEVVPIGFFAWGVAGVLWLVGAAEAIRQR